MTVAKVTDTQGNANTDPTRNVLDLVDAAIRRQDDLREASEVRLLGLADERARCTREDREADNNHAKELRIAEAARIDAIRSVDVGAVQRAAEVQQQQATALATQATSLAETLRTQVATTATAQTVALAAALEPIIKDISELRRNMYESVGQKQQVVESRSALSQSSTIIFALLGVLQASIIIAVAIYAATN